MSDLSELVADPLVELFAFHTEEVLSRLQDATFDGDGSGSINVVSSHHADSDAGPLAPFDGFWYLKSQKYSTERLCLTSTSGERSHTDFFPLRPVNKLQAVIVLL